MLTQAELHDCLSYDAETGIFVWIKTYWNKKRLLGKEAGGLDPEGYRQIKINRRNYRAHNLAWLYVHGRFPAIILDHIDGVKDNNAISNLREVTFAENSQNQKRGHIDGEYGLGVDYNKSKKRFRARIAFNGKRITLGSFATAEEARKFYLEAKRKLHPTCTI